MSDKMATTVASSEQKEPRTIRSLLFNNLYSRHYTWQLLATSSLLTLSSANYAFDNQGFSQTQAMDVFIRRFGQPDPSKKSGFSLSASFLAYSNAFPLLLLVCGIAIGSEVSSRWGRRWTCFSMSIWGLICTPIILTSQHNGHFLAARCLNSIYIGMEMAVIPIFQAEIVPKQVRGLAVASYQLSFAFGGIVMSGICHRTATIPNDWSWRIPFLCFLVVPSIVATLIFFQPESPRWLVLKGRHEEARKALSKFRRKDCDVDYELKQIIDAVHLEQIRIDETRAESGHGKNSLLNVLHDNLACFRPRANLRRTMIVVAVMFFQQSTGQALAGLYGPVVVKNLQIFSPFNYTLIMTGITGFTYLFNITLNDHIGRRPLLMLSSSVQSACFFAMGGLGSITHRSKSEDKALLAVIILAAVAYCAGWGPLSYVVAAETPSQALRDKTARLGFLVGIVTQFIVVFSLPYMLYKPGYLNMKVAFIFAPMATLACIWVYFFLPECAGLSLEQLDLLFEKGIPARRSPVWGKEHRDLAIISESGSRPSSVQRTSALFVDALSKDGHAPSTGAAQGKSASVYDGISPATAQSPAALSNGDKSPTYNWPFDAEKGASP